MLNKKNILPLIASLLGFIFTACETDINLYTDVKSDQVIIYGVLDCSAKTQVVRIGKMIRPDATALDFLSLATPVQSDSLAVDIQEWANGLYCNYNLPVADSQENSNMTLFKGIFEPYDFMEYKLVVTNKNTGSLIIAKTLPLTDPKILKPGMDNMACTFSDTLNPFEFKYSVIPRGMIYQLELRIQYVEFTMQGDTLFKEGVFAFNPVYVDDPPDYVPTRINYGKDVTRTIPPQYILNIFARIIPSSPSVDARLLYRFNFTVWAGNDILRNYIQMGSKYEDNRKQFFSNIVGGYGLFASCSHIAVTGLRPDDAFLTNLSESPTTSKLKFKRYLYNGRFSVAKDPVQIFPNLMNPKCDEGY